MAKSKANHGIKPLSNHVLILPDQLESKSPGGIVLPENAQKQSTTGRVVAVGPGLRTADGTRQPIEVNIGDRVMYQLYAGQKVPDKNGQECLLVLESEILAILDD